MIRLAMTFVDHVGVAGVMESLTGCVECLAHDLCCCIIEDALRDKLEDRRRLHNTLHAALALFRVLGHFGTLSITAGGKLGLQAQVKWPRCRMWKTELGSTPPR